VSPLPVRCWRFATRGAGTGMTISARPGRRPVRRTVRSCPSTAASCCSSSPTRKPTAATAPPSSCAALRAPDACRPNQRRNFLKMPARRLQRSPLAVWEREGLKAALVKAGLPADDVGDPRLLVWRFETFEDVPVGFGGLGAFRDGALLRPVGALPAPASDA